MVEFIGIYLLNKTYNFSDVKAGNILISDKGAVQLADFGVAGSMLEVGDRSRKSMNITVILIYFSENFCWYTGKFIFLFLFIYFVVLDGA